MLRLVRMSGAWKGIEIEDLDREEMENIETFVSEGEAVLIVDDLDSLPDDIDPDDVEIFADED